MSEKIAQVRSVMSGPTLGWTCLAASLTLALAACTPETITQGPLTTRPQPVAAPPASSGAIYQAASSRPLFEDRRARLVGDILTININENTTAAKQGANSNNKSGSVSSAVSAFMGSPLPQATMAAASADKYDDKAITSSSNNFSGTIAVTVIEVLPNGNLVVGGEKQVALDHGVEFVRFSGVVNPDYIVLGNTVSSTRVADARVEYRTNSRIDGAQLTSILARFFMSFIPL